jgi:hypothetical protein
VREELERHRCAEASMRRPLSSIHPCVSPQNFRLGTNDRRNQSPSGLPGNWRSDALVRYATEPRLQ